jgi:hypothetical protein
LDICAEIVPDPVGISGGAEIIKIDKYVGTNQIRVA